MSKNLEQLNPPILQDVIEASKRNLSTSINCVNIGIIQSFDSATQTATVQLALKRIKEILADGTIIYYENQLLLKDLPVVTLFGNGSFLSMPIAPGDNCIILFNDREIDQWYANGGVQATQTFRAHSLSDGIVIVGINSLQTSIADYLVAGIRLSFSSNSRISLTDDAINSIAGLFKHTGNMEITENLTVDGNELIKGDLHVQGGMEIDGVITGNGGGGTININANVTLQSGKTLTAPIINSGNGATGSFANVVVVNGIVTGGS